MLRGVDGRDRAVGHVVRVGHVRRLVAGRWGDLGWRCRAHPRQRCRSLPSDPPGETGTHFFPAIAPGDPGKVDVAYLRTPEIAPTDPLGKADPGGCARPGPANGNPTTYARPVELESVRRAVAQPHLDTRPGHVGDDGNHSDTDACRRHLQPRQSSASTRRSNRNLLAPPSARLRPHRVRRRQHREHAAVGQPDFGAVIIGKH